MYGMKNFKFENGQSMDDLVNKIRTMSHRLFFEMKTLCDEDSNFKMPDEFNPKIYLIEGNIFLKQSYKE